VFAIEQPAAQFSFKCLDLMADGALRNAQLLRRLGEAFVPRSGFKSPQSIERWQAAHRQLLYMIKTKA
jgi:hypothetical protein